MELNIGVLEICKFYLDIQNGENLNLLSKEQSIHVKNLKTVL